MKAQLNTKTVYEGKIIIKKITTKPPKKKKKKMQAELLMQLPFVRGSEYLKGKAEIAQPYGRKRSPRNALIIKILKKEKTRVLLLLIMLLQAAMGQNFIDESIT